MRLYSQFLLNNAAANNTLDSRTCLSNRCSAPSTCRSSSVQWWTVRAIARAMMPLGWLRWGISWWIAFVVVGRAKCVAVGAIRQPES